MESFIGIGALAILLIWVRWLIRRNPEIDTNKREDSPYQISSAILFLITLIASIILVCFTESLKIQGLSHAIFISTLFCGLVFIFWFRVIRQGSKKAKKECTISGAILVFSMLLSELLSLGLK